MTDSPRTRDTTVAARARARRRRRRRGKLTWRSFCVGLGQAIRTSGPRVGSIFGLLFAAVGGWNLAQDFASLEQLTDLEAGGQAATAVVVRVDEQYHSNGKGGGHTEYWPITRQTIDGDTFDTPLQRYSTADQDRYRTGQRVEILYDPDDHRTVALGGHRARTLLEDNRNRDSIIAGVGAVIAAASLPIDLRRTVRARRARRARKRR